MTPEVRTMLVELNDKEQRKREGWVSGHYFRLMVLGHFRLAESPRGNMIEGLGAEDPELEDAIQAPFPEDMPHDERVEIYKSVMEDMKKQDTGFVYEDQHGVLRFRDKPVEGKRPSNGTLGKFFVHFIRSFNFAYNEPLPHDERLKEDE